MVQLRLARWAAAHAICTRTVYCMVRTKFAARSGIQSPIMLYKTREVNERRPIHHQGPLPAAFQGSVNVFPLDPDPRSRNLGAHNR